MKEKLLLIFFSLFTIFLYPQKITITELQNICSKKNWEEVNDIMNNKGWEYHQSSKGDSDKYNTIVWSYNKSTYNDEAEAWFYLYTYEGFPNKVAFNVFNKKSYLSLNNSVGSYGYKKTDSTINDDEISIKYTNQSFILEITSSKRKKSESYSLDDESFTSYKFNLTKKRSIYDFLNGEKTNYYSDGTIKEKYTLKNGNKDGVYQIYHPNGQLKEIHNFINGVENGITKEFDGKGAKILEYNSVDGKFEGKALLFENNQITKELWFKNGEKNGLLKEYSYSKNGMLISEINGYYLNDLKEGNFINYVYNNGVKQKYTYQNYKAGELNGSALEVDNSKVIFCNYKNNKLEGRYLKFNDTVAALTNTIPVIDTLVSRKNSNIKRLLKLQEGNYSSGLISGKWKEFSDSGELEGVLGFKDGVLNGETKFYLLSEDVEGKYPNLLGNVGELQNIYNYKNGALNGIAYKYFLLSGSGAKVIEKTTYLDDLKHGSYHSINKNTATEVQGNYLEGKENGIWTLKHVEGKYEIYYENGEVEYSNYYNNKNSKIRSVKKSRSYNHFWVKTLFNDQKESQEFWVKEPSDIITLNIDNSLSVNNENMYRNGNYIKYDLAGDILVSGKYFKRDKVGFWHHFHRKQGIKIETVPEAEKQIEKYYDSVNNLFSGEFIRYNSSEKTKEVIKIKNGLRNGKTVFYNIDSGKKIKKVNYKEGIIN